MAQAGGLIRLSGRIPKAGDTQSIIMSPGSSNAPRTQVRLAAPSPPDRDVHKLVTAARQKGPALNR